LNQHKKEARIGHISGFRRPSKATAAQFSFPGKNSHKRKSDIQSGPAMELKGMSKIFLIREVALVKNGHWVSVPPVFLTGKNGSIKFTYSDPNFRKRTDPDLLLAAASAGIK
jgi:hypothetical protein